MISGMKEEIVAMSLHLDDIHSAEGYTLSQVCSGVHAGVREDAFSIHFFTLADSLQILPSGHKVGTPEADERRQFLQANKVGGAMPREGAERRLAMDMFVVCALAVHSDEIHRNAMQATSASRSLLSREAWDIIYPDLLCRAFTCIPGYLRT